MSNVTVQAEVLSSPDTATFLRLTRWDDAARRERVSVQVRRTDGVMEGEVDVDLLDLMRAVEALLARAR